MSHARSQRARGPRLFCAPADGDRSHDHGRCDLRTGSNAADPRSNRGQVSVTPVLLAALAMGGDGVRRVAMVGRHAPYTDIAYVDAQEHRPIASGRNVSVQFRQHRADTLPDYARRHDWCRDRQLLRAGRRQQDSSCPGRSRFSGALGRESTSSSGGRSNAKSSQRRHLRGRSPAAHRSTRDYLSPAR